MANMVKPQLCDKHLRRVESCILCYMEWDAVQPQTGTTSLVTADTETLRVLEVESWTNGVNRDWNLFRSDLDQLKRMPTPEWPAQEWPGEYVIDYGIKRRSDMAVAEFAKALHGLADRQDTTLEETCQCDECKGRRYFKEMFKK